MVYVTKRLFWIVVTGIVYGAMFHGHLLGNVWEGISSTASNTVASAQAHSVAADHPVTLSGATAIQVGFSPGNAEQLVVKTIDGAQKTIDVAAYSFTSAPIAKALVTAAKRGVAVRVVMDKSQRSERYSSATFLANAGVPVRINSRYSIMHNKFLVVDATTVETGSFNYTRSAHVRNAENVMVLHTAPQIAQTYSDEWSRLWSESSDYAARD